MTGLRRVRNPLVRFARVLGPGLVTGASDDDPSGVGTYAQAGARYGFATLWMAVAMLPLMASIQYICAKIGLVTGHGLAGVLRQHYPRRVLYPVVIALIVANTINAGADIGAVAASLNLLVPLPAIVYVIPVSVAILALQLFANYELMSRVFKWLALALLAYIAAALLARPDAGAVLIATVVPTIRLDPGYVAMIVAMLGTTISPYLFFWQSGQIVEEQIDMGRRRLWQRRGASRPELRNALWDTLAGMIFSEVVAYFIILATGATLSGQGHDIQSAADAARALRPVAGDGASMLLAIGLVGSGVLAVPVLTGSAAYGVSETLRWQAGLDKPPHRAPAFYGVIVAATLVGVGLNFLGINLISALVLASVINGIVAVPVLVLVLLVSNDRAVMGGRTNSRATNVLGWLTALVMAVAVIALFVTSLRG